MTTTARRAATSTAIRTAIRTAAIRFLSASVLAVLTCLVQPGAARAQDAGTGAADAAPRLRAGTVELRDIAIDGGAGAAIGIGRIAFKGFSRDGDAILAERIDVEAVEMRVAAQTVRIPDVHLADVRLPDRLYRALTEGGGPDTPWVALFLGVKADMVTIDRITVADTAKRFEQTLSGFVLTGLADGVVGSARLGAFTATTTPEPGKTVRIESGELRYRTLDIGNALRIVVGGGDGTAKRLLEHASIDGLTITADDLTMRIGRYEVGNVVMAVPREPLPPELVALMEMPDPAKSADPAVLAAAARWYRHLLRDFRIETYRFEGIAATDAETKVSIDRIGLDGFGGRGFDLFAVEGISVEQPSEHFRLDRFAVEKVSWGGLVDLVLDALARGEEPVIPPGGLGDRVQVAAVRVAGLSVGTPQGPVSLDRLALEADNGPDGIPRRLSFALAGLSVPVGTMTSGKEHEELVDLGYETLKLDATTTVRWSPDDETLTLEGTAVTLQDAGRIGLAAQVAGLDLAALTAAPERADAILDRAAVREVRLEVTDLGLAQRIYAALARRSGDTPQAVRDEIARRVEEDTRKTFGSALSAADLDRVVRFVRQPGEIAITLRPRGGRTSIRLPEIVSLGPEIVSRLTISVTTRNPAPTGPDTSGGK